MGKIDSAIKYKHDDLIIIQIYIDYILFGATNESLNEILKL